MTATRDPDRLLRAWLDLMPDEAPDRVIASVLQATAAAPQARVLPWLGPRRSVMNRFSIAAVVAAVAVAIGGIWYLNRPVSDIGPPPSPSPSPTAETASVPVELQFTWLGDLRDVPGLPTDRSVLGFDGAKAHYLESFDSTVSSTTQGRLELTLDAAHVATGCEAGDAGSYEYALSQGGTKVGFTALSDDCQARADAISGDWLRSDCLNTENWCLGPLEAGEYQSYFIAPRVVGFEWAPDYGAISYTVPDGWAATADWPRDYFLEPADWYAENRGDIGAESRGIYVGSHVAALEPRSSCAPGLAVEVERSADAIGTWLSEHPALDAGPPVAITIDGVEGVYVDGSLAASAEAVCRSAPTPVALLFGEDGLDEAGRAWGALEGQRARWILLDLEPDRPILIMITARDDLYDELLAEAMPIVESFRFE